MPDQDSNIHLKRLRELAAGKCAGSLTEDEVTELAGLLDASERFRKEYLQITSIHAKLDWDFGMGSVRTDALAAMVSDVAAAKRSTGSAGLLRRALFWGPALAACLMLGVTVRSMLAPQPRTAALPQTLVGSLVEGSPASRWTLTGGAGFNPGSVREGDTIWLEQGALDLNFVSNTVASLQAPALMHVVSQDRVRVLQGGVKVEVAEGAEGFAVETESAEVIDLGTIFSVNVAEGNTDLVVFDGEVDLKVPAAEADSPATPNGIVKRLRAGEAVQVSRAGTLSRIVNVRQSRPAAAGDGGSDGALIVSVRDNNLRSDFYSYYEIVPGGMGEDAKAFVDRRHEWNGATSAGMPGYLLGGDYVKTFNDDKVISQLDIEVELSAPASVYVLMDKRLTPPDWLVGAFEDTGDEIGIEETPYYPDSIRPSPEASLAAGPGAGVKRSHAIWTRRVPQGGVVQLGANGPLADDVPEGVMSRANMYGIVVVPLAPFGP